MALTLDDLKHKVDNNGATPEGRYPAEEYNTLLDAVKTAVADILKNAQSIDDVPDLISQATNDLFEFFAGTSYDFKGLATPDKPMTAGGLTSGRSVYLLWQPGDYSYLDANGDLQQLITLTEPTLTAVVIGIPLPQVWEIFSVSELRDSLEQYFMSLEAEDEFRGAIGALEDLSKTYAYKNTRILLCCDATITGIQGAPIEDFAQMLASELGCPRENIFIFVSPYVKLQYQGVSDRSTLTGNWRYFDWVNMFEGLISQYTNYINQELRPAIQAIQDNTTTDVSNLLYNGLMELLRMETFGGYDIVLIQGGVADVYGAAITSRRPMDRQLMVGLQFKVDASMWDVEYESGSLLDSLQWLFRTIQNSGYNSSMNVSFITPVYSPIGTEYPNSGDTCLGDIVNNLLKTNFQRIATPVCDLYNIGINSANQGDFDAGYEPSDTLKRRYARKIAQHIREYYPDEA